MGHVLGLSTLRKFGDQRDSLLRFPVDCPVGLPDVVCCRVLSYRKLLGGGGGGSNCSVWGFFFFLEKLRTVLWRYPHS